MSAGLKVDARAFDQAARTLEERAIRNTEAFGKSIAREFETTAKAGAPWTDRHGNARQRLYGEAKRDGKKVTVEMGGSAPNYKRKSKYEDYMELLEFGHESQHRDFPNLAIVYPTFDAIKADFVKQYGQSALSTTRFRISRSREASRDRSRRWRRERRAK